MNTSTEQENIRFIEGAYDKKAPFHNVFPVPHNVLEAQRFKEYKPSIKVFYFYLAHLANRFADDFGWFWHSNKMLAEDIGLDIKTIRAAKKKLCEDGYIEFKEGAYNPVSKIRQAGWFLVKGFQIKETLFDDKKQQENQGENDKHIT